MITQLLNIVIFVSLLGQREIIPQYEKWTSISGPQLVSFNAAYQELCKLKISSHQKKLENYTVRIWRGKEHDYVGFEPKVDNDEELPTDPSISRNGVHRVFVVSIKNRKVVRSW